MAGQAELHVTLMNVKSHVPSPLFLPRFTVEHGIFPENTIRVAIFALGFTALLLLVSRPSFAIAL